MTPEEAKKYIKEFIPNDDIINEVESQIKRGERHVQVFTTHYVRTYAEDCAEYFRKLGYNYCAWLDLRNIAPCKP